MTPETEIGAENASSGDDEELKALDEASRRWPHSHVADALQEMGYDFWEGVTTESPFSCHDDEDADQIHPSDMTPETETGAENAFLGDDEDLNALDGPSRRWPHSHVAEALHEMVYDFWEGVTK